jgi:putative nucleotidyltransferase with HDIG domain
MSTVRRHPAVLNALVLAVTIVFVALALLVGRARAGEPISIEVGEPSPITFTASADIEVLDEMATKLAREAASNSVEAQYSTDPQAAITTRRDIALFFQDAQQVATPTPVSESETPGDEPATEAPDEEVVEAEPPPDEGAVEETTTTTTTTQAPTTTTTLAPVPFEEQVIAMVLAYPELEDSTIRSMTTLLNQELVGEIPAGTFRAVEREADEIAVGYLDEGILIDDLAGIQRDLLDPENPPFIFGTDLEGDALLATRRAVGDLVQEFLNDNRARDLNAEADLRTELEAAVPDKYQSYQEAETIVLAGEVLSEVAVSAITDLGLLEPEEPTSLTAIFGIGAMGVLLTAFFLWRIAPGQWSSPKHFALLGVLLVLGAAASRVPELVGSTTPELGYLMPAVAFGYLAAILYDPRTAVLMSVPVAAFTAVSSGDLGLTVFAAGATVAPVAFVSSVSSRQELRIAVPMAALLVAPLAAATEAMFGGGDAIWPAAALGAAGAVIAGVVAQGLLSFLENLFRVTTTLTLLDLADRNHPALRVLEEKAPGTFNHSILVGNLAGKAARAINADPLLAQAAAYYHDLGKTEQPQYFIENQFGVSNPHDELPPIESAQIIRNHVLDGLRLARQFRIPAEVAQGIEMHHGTGLMRYFYHKAMEDEPGIEPELFRHRGQKPRRKEMAILMIADAVEAAARSLAQHEDPTGESLKKLVDTVVGEKLDDGQLDRSELTFGDLTKVKEAFVIALIGYYHTRVPYPGFPGPRVSA